MLQITPVQKKIKALIWVPGSKSYTNRALILAALAKGKSEIINPLFSDDTFHMINALKQLGVKLEISKNKIIVHGVDGYFKKNIKEIFLGNSGTSVRFLSALVATQNFESTVTGDKNMQKRPIQDLIDSLRAAGVQIKSIKNNGCPPLKIKGPAYSDSIKIKSNTSSQYTSALLMSAPYFKGQNKSTKINLVGQTVSLPYLQMTLKSMRDFGAQIKSCQDVSNKRANFGYEVAKSSYNATNYIVEPDASSAVYFFALALITNSSIEVLNLNKNSLQADLKFLDVIKKMGARIEYKKNSIKVTGTKNLKHVKKINLESLPDAAMMIAVLCALIKGKTVLDGLQTLRVKETDRLEALKNELNKIGTKTVIKGNSLVIESDPKKLNGNIIKTYNDHRMAMCFAILGTKIDGIKILNPDCVSKTYPNFFEDLKKCGVKYFEPNIILVGLRGSGKTSAGKLLAQKLNRRFIDIDRLIEQQVTDAKHGAKLKIKNIVARFGWKKFRKLEAKIIKKFASKNNSVISLGGGALENASSAKLLKKSGTIILLSAPIKTLVARIKNDSNRPRLTKEKSLTDELNKLWKKREKNFLLFSDLSVNSNASIKKVVQEIVESIK